ncbi:MAG: hypothetical protein MZV64_15400 [Ignavibacteriales bacterium]|nr:hypothetical protein [Ignavibacteriales bacterium]
MRPLILFPSTILTLAGGFVFGPVPRRAVHHHRQQYLLDDRILCRALLW